MTLSPARRESDQDRALAHMVHVIADGHLTHRFLPTDPGFAGVAPSTFPELMSQGFLRYAGNFGQPAYFVTPLGWLAGLRAAGCLESVELRDRCQRVVRALKARVKEDNRSSPLPIGVFPDVIASIAEVQAMWLLNALESGLLQQIFPNQQMNAFYERKLVKIPPTFGFPI